MRTQEELVARVKKRIGEDTFGFEVDSYLPFLEYVHAKPYIENGVTEADWDKIKLDPANVRQTMKDYLPFAWEKANDKRGLSAGRSMSRYVAWLWIDNTPQAQALIDSDLENYCDYGMSNLEKIGQLLGAPSGRETNADAFKKWAAENVTKCEPEPRKI